jgi:hypothetical protein
MAADRRQRFIDTYKAVTTFGDPKYDPLMTTLLNLHGTNFGSLHGDAQYFLPWHRWYIMAIEDVLRKADCRVTVPWWRWSKKSSNWYTGTPFHSSTNWLGGDGVASSTCVIDGPFVLPWKPPGEICLKRNFNTVSMPTLPQIATVLALPQASFMPFSGNLEGQIHNSPHCRINGFMCSGTSSKAPEFFLHHAYIDKLWDDWQVLPSTYPFPTGVPMAYTIGPTPATAGYHLDLKKSRVIYVKVLSDPVGPGPVAPQCSWILGPPSITSGVGRALQTVSEDRVVYNLDEIEVGLIQMARDGTLSSVQQRPVLIQTIEEMKQEFFWISGIAGGIAEDVLETQLRETLAEQIAANAELEFPTTDFRDDASTMLGFDVATVVERLKLCPIGSTTNSADGSCGEVSADIQTMIDTTLATSTVFLGDIVNNADLGDAVQVP